MSGPARKALALAIVFVFMHSPSRAAAGGATVIDLSARPRAAHELTESVLHGIETFQPNAMLEPLAQAAVAQDPDFALHYILLSRVSPSPARVQAALEKAQRLAGGSDSGEDQLIRALLDIEANRFDEAVSRLQGLAREYPRDRLVRMSLAQSLLEMGKPRRALPHLRAARGIDPHSARVYALLADSLLLQGDHAGAAEGYRQAIRRAHPLGRPYGVYAGLVLSHLSQGRPGEAQEVLESYLRPRRLRSESPESDPDRIWVAPLSTSLPPLQEPPPGRLRPGLEAILKKARVDQPGFPFQALFEEPEPARTTPARP